MRIGSNNLEGDRSDIWSASQPVTGSAGCSSVRPVSEALEHLSRQLLAAVDDSLVSVPQADLFIGLSERLRALPPPRSVRAQTLPVVDEWLAAAVAAAPEPWSDLAHALLAASSRLPWLMAYENLDPSPGLEAFQRHYSFALLAGPSFRGHQPPQIDDQMIAGFSIQAPQVLYPPHHHAPPELYGIISGAVEWQIGDTWTLKGAGDTAIHRAHESHAMRSVGQPVLTWVCWPHGAASHVYMPSLDPPNSSMAPISY